MTKTKSLTHEFGFLLWVLFTKIWKFSISLLFIFQVSQQSIDERLIYEANEDLKADMIGFHYHFIVMIDCHTWGTCQVIANIGLKSLKKIEI